MSHRPDHDVDCEWVSLPETVLGLISDTHGQAERTEAALRRLEDAGAELILHLGDVGSDAVVDRMVGRNVRIVLGNVDSTSLGRYAGILDLVVDHPAMRLEISGRRIGATHGHLSSEMDRLLAEKPHYLLHGHSHVAGDRRIGETRVLNPGAVQRAAIRSVAILEPGVDRFEILEIPRD